MSSPDPFGRAGRPSSAWRRTLIYFGLADDPDAPTASDGRSTADVTERLDEVERRLAEQQRTLEEIHDLLRRDAGR